MYDTTIGKWMEEDPIQFKPGEPNLYRYCGNDPTNATDPSGLEKKEIDEKIDFPHYYHIPHVGRVGHLVKGEFEVISNATYDGRGGYIEFSFYWPEVKGSQGEVHYLQFTTHENTLKDGSVEHHHFPEKPAPGVAYRNPDTDRLYYFGDEPALDTTSEDRKKPWYDSGKGAYKSGGEDGEGDRKNYMRIWDKPDDVKLDPKKYIMSTAIFDTYLVYNGDVLYHVSWRKEQEVKDGKWTAGEYKISKDMSGPGIGEKGALPAVLNTAQWYAGYTVDENMQPDKKIIFKNPFLK